MLVSNVPRFKLLAGDRLEPSPALPDVAALNGDTKFPICVTFWRPSENTLQLHRCPLWDESLGLTPTRSIALDILHTFHLGIVLVWAKFVVWYILRSRIWGEHEKQACDQISIAVLRFRNELMAFYGRERQKGVHHTEVSDITQKMLGSPTQPKLKVKGMEAFGVLCFCMDRLKTYKARLDGRCNVLIDSGECLLRMVVVWKAQPWAMTTEANTVPRPELVLGFVLLLVC